MLANLFGKTEERTLQVTPWGDAGWTGYGGSSTHVSTDNALQLLTVYGATALIADTIATLPQDVFRSADGPPVPVAQPRWLEEPNDQTDIIELKTQLLTSLLLDGNAYLAYTLDRGFVVNQVTVLDPNIVSIRPEGTPPRPAYFVNGERFKGLLKHVKGITRPGHWKGLSPLEAARQSISLGLSAQEYGAKFYSNGIHMSGVIEWPGDINKEQLATLKSGWMRDHAGLGKAWEPGVLHGGAQWKPISVTPEQAQFLESRKFQAAEIAAQMFLLDPTLLGIPVDGKSLTYANLEQRGIHLVQFTLLRWIIRLEKLFSSLLPKPQYAKLNVAGLQRADLLTRYQAYAIGTGGAQFLQVDEAREKEDLGPMPKVQVEPPVEEEPPDES